MSAFRGILTGYLGAKIADTEAADRLKGEVLASASKDLLTNILPEQRAAEELRRKNYNNLASMYNPNIAELGDINDFTRDEASMEKFENFLKKNKLKDPEAFKNLQFETDFNTRYDQRGIAFNEKFQPLLKQIGIDQQGGMGFYTIKNQLSEPGQTDQTMEQPGQTPEAPQEFASTQLSDYFSPIQSTVDLGTPNQVDQAISGYRGFDQGIIRDNAGNFAGMELFGEKANERNAFKAVMTRIAPNYVVGDTNKADLTSTAQVADKVLFDQTQGHIGDQILDGYQAATFKEKIRDRNFDINRYNATGFTKSFNEAHPTDDNKIEAILDYMYDNLQTRAERVHFAQSFAANIKDSDDNSYRNMLLIAIDPTLVIQDQ